MENQEQNQTPQQPEEQKYWGMSETSFSSFLHIAQFAGFILPVAGWALPIVMWSMNNSNKFIDTNGKHVINWLISSTIYIVITSILTLLLIGLPLLIIVGVLSLIFPIVGAVKAGSGVAWKYPLSIPFFKV